MLLIFTVLCGTFIGASSSNSFKIHMPAVTTNQEDAYLCTHLELESNKYLIGYEPDADMNIAHHMLMYKCRTVFGKGKVYPCSQPCFGGQIIYAWARQAPSLYLPKGVAFEAGPELDFSYIVLQVHYKLKITKPDSSGVRILTVDRPQPGIAGVMLMSADGPPIPRNSKSAKMLFGCKYSSKTTIYPFAFRTHAHTLGRTIFAYHYSDDECRPASGDLIGRGSPQWPQAFYSTFSTKPINRGDVLVGSCVYDSQDRNRTTYVGSTHNDEMCNFYMMFYRKRHTEALASEKLFDECSGIVRQIERCVDSVPANLYKYLPTTLPERMKTTRNNKNNSDHWNLTIENLGQVSGVSVDSKGRLYIFHRGDRVWNATTFDLKTGKLKDSYQTRPISAYTIIIANRTTGAVISRHGRNMFYMPHGIYTDFEDNVWVTDVGLHQVIKLVWNGGHLVSSLTLGERFEPGNDDKHFCKPTDVTSLKSGDFYVADGYCNSRIMKFSKDGQFLTKLRSKTGNFNIPHSLTNLGESRICVADRERARIECFSTSSDKHVLLLKGNPAFGSAVYAIISSDGNFIYGVTMKNRGPKGFTFSLMKNNVSSQWGSDLKRPHDVAYFDNHIYVAELDQPYRVAVYKMKTAKKDTESKTLEKELDEIDSLSLSITPISKNVGNETRYESKGFMDLLSANTPLLVSVVIVLPLAIIVIGALITHLHRKRVYICFYLKGGGRTMKSRNERGRFEPLLNDDDESDSDENEDILNIATMKRKSGRSV